MKNIKLLLISIMVILLCGCSNDVTKIGDKSNDVSEISGITMEIKEDTLTNTGMTVIINDTNNQGTYIYDEYYRLDKKIGGVWYDVEFINEDNNFNDIAYSIGDDGTLEFDINWEHAYGKLSSGTYRLVKETTLTNNASDNSTLYFAVEFVID